MNPKLDADHEARVARLIDLKSWAVVRVSQNPRKYGHRVFLTLLSAGYDAKAVNPKGGNVAGHAVLPSIASIPKMPDAVVTVVPPAITEKVVEECAALGIKHLWMQPGSESDAAIAAAVERGITVVAHDCLMVRRKHW
jgi:hypothetical protein